MNVFEDIKNKKLTQEKAAKKLKMSLRQLKRKFKRYQKEGAAGLAHKGRGKQSNRALEETVQEKILVLIKEKYLLLRDKPGPTFIADQLSKNEDINVDHETLRRLMIKHGLWTVLSRKQRRHVWRERKHHFGELVQIDGSLHIWFGTEKVTLIAFIDDATSTILAAKFVHRESTEDLATMTQEYVKQYGRPHALYSDRGSTYKISNNKKDLRVKTQYERMLQELDIELIHARSPQAKGRIERLFGTLQDRLVKELELNNIVSIGAANTYLKKTYIPEHNQRFAIDPQENADFHRSIDGFDLHSIFCRKFKRTISNDYTIRFNSQWFQLERKQPLFVRRGQLVSIHQYFDGTIDIIRQKHKLIFKRIAKQENNQKPIKKANKRVKELVYQKPPSTHPWRQYQQEKVSVLKSSKR